SMAFATLILILHIARDSRLFDYLHASRPANNGRVRKPMKEAVSHDPGYRRKRMRQGSGVVNPAKLGIDNPVAAVSDKRMAVLRLSYHQRAGLLDAFYRRLARSVYGRLFLAASIDRCMAATPNGTTSTGSGNRPSTSTHLLSSAITIMRSEAAATIFSRSKAPPPPLIRERSGAISSAPSIVRSS